MYRYKTSSQNLTISGEKIKDTLTVAMELENNPSLGRFFLYGKIKTADQGIRKFFEALFNLAKNYYTNSTISDSEMALEDILKKLNAEWQGSLTKNTFLGRGSDLRQKLENISLTIGILDENTLYLASVGQTHLFLIRDNKIKDILGSEYEDPKTADLSKLFTNLIAGKLKENDILFFCFGDFLDYFSLEKIKRIAQDYPPERACQYFSDLLHPIEHRKTFVVNILKLMLKKSNEMLMIRPEIKRSEASQSMENLINTQEETENTINTSRYPENLRPKTWWKNANEKIKEFLGALDLGKFFEGLSGDTKERMSVWRGRWVNNGIFGKGSSSLGQMSNIETSSSEGNLKNDLRKNLVTKKGKIYAIAFATIVIVLGTGIILAIRAQARNQLTKEYNSIVQQIEEKKSLAEAALIYKNTASAGDFFNEINGLLDKMPKNTSEREQKYEELKKTNQEQLDALMKLYAVEPEVVLSFESLGGDFKATGGLRTVDGKIYFWDERGVYETKDGQISKLADAGDENLKYGTWWEPGRIAFITQNQKLAVLDIKSGEWQILEISANHQPVQGKGLVIYNNRLYFLDENGQIYKYARGENGFENETAWLASGKRLDNAEQLNIDSALWLIVNGTVKKFYQGKEEGWTTPVMPILNSPRLLLTGADMKQLYIFDSADKRVIILNKDGQVVKQLKSDTWEDAVALGADEADGQVFVVGQRAVYAAGWK